MDPSTHTRTKTLRAPFAWIDSGAGATAQSVTRARGDALTEPHAGRSLMESVPERPLVLLARRPIRRFLDRRLPSTNEDYLPLQVPQGS